MLIYATPAELTTWMGRDAPDNATTLLREASTLVADACLADIYDTTPDRMPTDQSLRDAMRDATCIQAAFWAAHGIDPAKGRAGMDEIVVSSSIDGASETTNAGELEAAKASSMDGLVPTALRLLRFAGLASNAVRSW
ncbi:hypothetical protein [Rhodococcus sp. Chr-9]|uniref:hypothetical protein n=1 Tax=Rhodococcus sp. Chr-9 TaxID=713612 RepID=UPI00057356BA|nr:hypothetical protein [Rhodococcus sp. Chr-9]KHJ74659.1 hypothetical protein QR64_00270 [Rhodococcus sp. Chr-9]